MYYQHHQLHHSQNQHHLQQQQQQHHHMLLQQQQHMAATGQMGSPMGGGGGMVAGGHYASPASMGSVNGMHPAHQQATAGGVAMGGAAGGAGASHMSMQQHSGMVGSPIAAGAMSPMGGGGGLGSQQQHYGNLPAGGIPAGPTPLPSVSKSSIIRDVWADNLEEEFKLIRELVVDYPFVAMDTEFPGVVAKPVGSFKLPHEFYYATLRYNVNLLKIIQLGISLLNERGEVPEGCCTWQFNFRFNLAEDTFAQDSIELLKTGGINFDHFCDHGIEITRFSELLFSSGLVLNPEVRWLAFHAGYDFGYLMRGLLNRDLPDKEEEFTAIFHQLFPSVFDIKYVLRQTDIMHSAGLDFLADSLSVRRLGTAHQAGSDSLLTGHSFFKLLRDRLNRQMPYHANGILYGLREDAAASNGALAHNGSSGMTPSTPPTANPYTPSGAQGTVGGQFPSTPLVNLVNHGGARDGKVHYGSK